MTGHNRSFTAGDWVMGRSKDGELIRGYIDSVDSFEDWVRVYVVASDNEETVGRTVVTLSKWVRKLPESSIDEEQLLHMIDLALLAHDEPWFMQLSAQLNRLRQSRAVNSEKFKREPLKNRLRRLGIGE